MRIIHFTLGATDPLKSFDAKGVHYVPLADGRGDTHLSCVHLEEGATINAPHLSMLWHCSWSTAASPS